MSTKLKIKTTFIALMILPSISNAQQTPIFQQVTARPKGLSNLADPLETMDSFLGQDKAGPYVLSWKNIIYTPSHPVYVSVDGAQIRTSEYNLNIEKGEITFNSIIKRTQIVNVKYGYFPEFSTKNANPALTNPLTIKLASNSFQGLTFTAMNPSNLSAPPAMIIGHTFKVNGFSSNYYANPTGKGFELQDAYKFGYNTGNVNNINASYEKSNKGFSSIAKTFGMIDSGEKSNLGGRYAFARNSKISFNNSNFKSLNSNIENNNTSANFEIAGSKNQPSFNYSYSDSDSVDAKNVKNSAIVQSTNFASNLGDSNLSYKSSMNDSAINGARTVNNQEFLSYRVKQLSYGRVHDFKIDPKTGTTSSITDSLNYSTKISGGSAAFSSVKTDATINNKEIQTDQTNYSLNFKGNKTGFNGLNLNRVQNNSVIGANETNVINDKASFGFGALNYSTNTVVSEFRGNLRKDVIDDKFTISLPQRKNAPTLSFSSTDSIKRNEKGILVGTSNDSTILKHQVRPGLLLGYNFGQTTTLSPDGKVVSIDNTTGNLSAKIGLGQFTTETMTNEITSNSNKPINQDINKYNFTIAPIKNMPGFELERIDTNSSQETNTTSNLSDRVKLSSKIGSASLNASVASSITDTNSSKQSDIKNNSLSVNTPFIGSAKLAVTANSSSNAMPIGDESKVGLGISLVPSKSISITSEQIDSKFISPKGDTINYSVNNRYSLNWNMTGALLQTSVDSIETNTLKSDVYNYRTVIGTEKTVFKLDSTVKMRDSTSNNVILNRDTTQTSIDFNTSRNFKVTGSYILNPDDPAKPGIIIPMEKRTYGMNARLGRLDLNGSYSSLEHLPGTSADIIAKAGGFNTLGESGVKLGYSAGSTKYFSEFRNQFYYGTNLKGIVTYTVGVTQTRNNVNFSLNGTFIKNQNNSTFSQDYRAEAKLGVKF
jgi:hypothetical protein